MKVDVYGKKQDYNCQNAVRLLKSASININFYDLEIEDNINKLKELQKSAEYLTRSLDSNMLPVVVNNDSKEILIGYSDNDNLYEPLIKEAREKELDSFIKKYPEFHKK